MSNAILHKADGTIVHFLRNARRIKNNVIGDNGEISTKQIDNELTLKWIDEEVVEIREDRYDDQQDETFNEHKGWAGNANDYAASAEEGPVIKDVSRAQLRRAIKMRRRVSDMTSAEVETYARNQCSDLPPGQDKFIDFVVNLTLVLHAEIRMSDYHRD